MSRLDEIEARERAATPGPWEWEEQSLADQPLWKTHFCGPPSLRNSGEAIVVNRGCADCQDEEGNGPEADFDFIAQAREDIPLLLAVARAVERYVKEHYACPVCGRNCIKNGVISVLRHAPDCPMLSLMDGEIADSGM